MVLYSSKHIIKTPIKGSYQNFLILAKYIHELHQFCIGKISKINF